LRRIFFRKNIGANVTGPEIFFTNRFCLFFQKPEQPDAIFRPVVAGRGMMGPVCLMVTNAKFDNPAGQ